MKANGSRREEGGKNITEKIRCVPRSERKTAVKGGARRAGRGRCGVRAGATLRGEAPARACPHGRRAHTRSARRTALSPTTPRSRDSSRARVVVYCPKWLSQCFPRKCSRRPFSSRTCRALCSRSVFIHKTFYRRRQKQLRRSAIWEMSPKKYMSRKLKFQWPEFLWKVFPPCSKTIRALDGVI